jgi:TonB-linked SusC/RagA family outer membrane protein
MYKNFTAYYGRWNSCGFFKFLLLMKLSIVLLLASLLQVSAATSYAQKLNVSFKRVPLENAFKQVRKLSGFNILYNSEMISASHEVSVTIKNATINQVMDKLLDNQGLNYNIIDNNVIITQKPIPVAAANAVAVIPISGKVTDGKNLPIPGVTVKVKNTQTVAVTNAEGVYKITVPDQNAILVFTSIGFEPLEMLVSNQKVISVTLNEQNTGLNEIVVIGYGTTKRGDLTGSVGSVNMTDLQLAPVKSFDEALAGRVAGVQATSVDGQPGSAVNIIIRGSNSVTQSNSPLYVVDGFPLEDNDNNAINPADIESIDVLKDASSTAIYGARGANGVIVITTKRGKAGVPVVNYNSYFGIQNGAKKIDLLSPYEFVKLQLQVNNTLATTNYLYGGKTLESYQDTKGTDWYDEVTQTARMQNHTVSVSGGNANGKYSFSGNYIGQDGIIKNSGFKRYEGRFTLDQNLTEKIKFGLTANYSNSSNYGTTVNSSTAPGNSISGTLSYMYSVWAFRPITIDPSITGSDLTNALFDPLTTNDNRVNPFIQVQNELRNSTALNFFTNAYAEYAITKNLKLRLTGGISKANRNDQAFNNSMTRSGSPFNPLTLGVNGSQSYIENLNLSTENTLTYSTTFNKKHNLNVVAGYTLQTNNSKLNGFSAIQVPNESLGLSGLDEGVPYAIQAGSSTWTLQSFLARANYTYDSKYLLTASIRADGSSKFAPQNRWGYFPSGAFAYRISQEGFMKKFKQLSDAKLRVSYGVTGNNRVGDFAYLSTIAFPTGFSYSFGNATPTLGAASSNLGNPAVKWESTKQLDIGFDVGFLNNRISLTGDYYRKVTSDLLLNAQLPAATGYSNAIENIGSVSNSGIEFSLNTVNIVGHKFGWTSNFNIAFNKNKILALSQGQDAFTSTTSGVYGGIAGYIAKIGQPISMFYGPIFDGLYQYSDFNKLTNGTFVLKDNVPTNGSARNTIQPGYVKYKDLNNDGIISSNDFTETGNPTPLYVGGMSNSFTYKGFDLNVFLQFSYGNDVMNENRIYFEGGYNVGYNTNMYATYANRWTPTNTNTNITLPAGIGPNYWSSLYVEDGSFLRLKTVSLGYTFTQKLLSKIKVKSIRIYATAQNLVTWTNYSGLDPEVSVRDSPLTKGIDFSAYPRAKTFVAGINVTF